MNTFWQFLRSEISVVIMHSQAWQMSVTFCCTHSVFLGGGQSQQRKPSSHSQGQNTGAMDTTWKGLQTGCFLQVGGKMTPKFHPHFKRLFFCELGEKAYPRWRCFDKCYFNQGSNTLPRDHTTAPRTRTRAFPVCTAVGWPDVRRRGRAPRTNQPVWEDDWQLTDWS